MRFVLISDTHEQHDRLTVPDGDVLIHAGDFTYLGEIAPICRFAKWMAGLPHKHKILIAGNHDILFEQQPSLAQTLLPDCITYLRDSSYVLPGGISVWGSPWTPRHSYGWAFKYERDDDPVTKWDEIPDDIDILVTHGPPRYQLDVVPRIVGNVTTNEHTGCEYLAKRLVVIRPKLHVFGHIHEGYGISTKDGITYVNASTYNNSSPWLNDPIVLDWDEI